MRHSASPLLLALDTSTHWVSVALYDGVSLLSEHTWLSRDYHTIELAPTVHQALERLGRSARELSCVAVAIGPGSFTGLRVGIALAKGLALGNRIPLVGVPSLDVLAASQPVMKLPMIAALRAGRGRLALRRYECREDKWQAQGEYQILTAEQLAAALDQPTWLCGEFDSAERQILSARPNALLASPFLCLRRAGKLAEIGWQLWQSGKLSDPATLSPIYLHFHEPIPT
ncbi:MAG: tRNA (adenosine(37)-N6)-threonylcarbamoyltransferase complex dimerization subunit type 1 TsaB [Anaerolineales bacterium]|nr:tRNA (adenosine(37)-N6)-threonylcarbamoyltransferase complex dimerization subunit type 1 TsaB [Anaerolineales bacterium]MCS7248297.1 tRNA (adenosine(37)-N6)-threonylcarbamoyltransferase complex dimerization subunit type 1 TsaB [Anaerolineales bacterium]MDW8162111.1 tRNA (adenosine(37)-N6)-threonylcarbamoyltransferase complex dimerization subunit type 1 TsaB [Anaerolineales bacterium]MDW8447615.1 tRNA (adenosine(37)-N6)-threonylcarbamoyltransferase complex dimerization subunit type 1 TsaB [Ana